MAHILIVDDEPQIRLIIKKYAEFEGYKVTQAENGAEAVDLCKKGSIKYDIIILDIMMPVMDGFLAAMEIRKFSTVPILMLSARGEEYERIRGFEIGADDYVVKPFSPKEIMLRINAILSRANSQNDNHDYFCTEGLLIDFTSRTVTIDCERVELSPKEYDLLYYLVSNKNIALSRDKLISNVWGYDFYGDDRTLDTHIKLLRKSLKEYSKFIITLRGVGYRFDC